MKIIQEGESYYIDMLKKMSEEVEVLQNEKIESLGKIDNLSQEIDRILELNQNLHEKCQNLEKLELVLKDENLQEKQN